MSKKAMWAEVLIFLLFIGGFFVANMLTPQRTFSEQENRVLQTMPRFTFERLFNKEFTTEFEDYTSDQFIFRDEWITLKAASELALGKKENNDVSYGKEQTLIEGFDAPDKSTLDTNMSYVNQLVQNTDANVYFALIPEKSEIWSDRLPNLTPNDSQAELIEYCYGLSNANNVDMLAPLREHADEYIYYRTDHHWTSLGAYYGYTGLATALGYTPVPLNDYTETVRSTEFYGTVFSSSGVRWVRPDTISTYVPDDGITVASHTYDNKGNPVEEPRQLYDTSFLSVKDKYSMFLGGNQPLGVVKNANNPDGPRLLIIRDSYADSLVPFLTPHFSEIHLLDLRYYKLSIADYIAQNGIDQALVLYSVPNFVTDSNLLWIAK